MHGLKRLFLSFLFASVSFSAWAETNVPASFVQACQQNCPSTCKKFASEPPEAQTLYLQCIRSCGQSCGSPNQGILYPRYSILALLYAPPGCTSTQAYKCPSESSVSYVNGSSLGTKVSVKASFKDDLNLSASDKVSFELASFQVGAGVDFTTTVTEGSSETITKSTSSSRSAQGTEDGVDHDLDTFILLINPAVRIVKSSNFTQWSYGYTEGSAHTYELSVQELKNPALMPANVAALLASYGFKDSDFKTILSQDPFADGSDVIDPARFVKTTWTVPYEPLPNGTAICSPFDETVKNDFAHETTTSYDDSYSVSTSTDANIGLGDYGELGLKESGKWTWTGTSSVTNTTGSSNAASVKIACPSMAYTDPVKDPTLIEIYWDTLYGSFMFSPVGISSRIAVARGEVLDAVGKPLMNQAVDLSYGNLTLHTATDQTGKYSFYRPSVTDLANVTIGQLVVRGITKTIPLSNQTLEIIRLN